MATRNIVMFSGGVASWAAGKRVASQCGTDNLTLLFADTLIEDSDLYRFLEEAAQNIGGELVKIAEGRTPWEVFFDERFLGNSRVDPCSKILKRQLLDKWLENNCSPSETLIAMGYDWSEGRRMEGTTARDTVWRRWAPLLTAPYLTKRQLIDAVRAEGIKPPRLYEMGFSHNNCGGTCVKAGQASWALLLKTFPDRYADWEAKEEAIRSFLNADVAILKDRKNKSVKPLTLRAFRESKERDEQHDLFDWGSCGCFQTSEEESNGET